MDLILWRHAEAEEGRPGLPDARRRLTPKGEKQARKVAKWLKKRLPDDTRILVSPTERTRMTAHALGMPYELEQAIGPASGAEELLRAAGWSAGDGFVLIVGHQPMLGHTASLLLAGREMDWLLRKGGLVWIAHGPTNGTAPELRAAVSPDLI